MTFGLDILDLKDYNPENNGGYRYVLVIIDNFSKIGWKVPLTNKNAQTIKRSFETILVTSKKNKIYSELIEKSNFIIIFSEIF